MLRNSIRQSPRLLRFIRQYVWPHLPLEFTMVVIALGAKILAYMDLVPSIDGHYHYILEIMWTLNNGTTDTKTYSTRFVEKRIWKVLPVFCLFCPIQPQQCP